MAFDERSDVGVARTGEQIAFPMAWNGAIVGFGRTLADRYHVDDLPMPFAGPGTLGDPSRHPDEMLVDAPSGLQIEHVDLSTLNNQHREGAK